MSQSTAVLVVSAFGRGHALAMSLAAKEIPVCLVDVSSHLGLTSPEEWEGPFGVNLSGLNGIQQERLNEDDPIIKQSEGLTVLLPSGPLEFRGPIVDHRLKKLGISDDVRDLLNINRISNSERDRIHNQPFSQTWPLFLLRHFSLNRLGRMLKTLEYDLIYRADSEFGVRQVSRLGLARSLEACARRLVHVKKPGVIKDISSLAGNRTRSVEFVEDGSAVSEMIEYEMLVWCLSSEETEFLSTGLAEKLYPNGVSRPDWCWTKYRFRMAPSNERESLPVHSIWVGDLELPWTHENFMVVQRTATPDLFDIWVRLPYSMRFQKSFLKEQESKIARRISLQSESLVPELNEEPTTNYQSYQETGPTRFPIFDDNGVKSPLSSPHLLMHSPETWPGLGWASVFSQDLLLTEKIETWWTRRLFEKQKQAAKEKGQHP